LLQATVDDGAKAGGGPCYERAGAAHELAAGTQEVLAARR
jgi:hypothetical protein